MIPVPSPGCRLFVHFLEVLAWEKSRYCIMIATTAGIQRCASMAISEPRYPVKACKTRCHILPQKVCQLRVI
jgi:hypothetical protein